MGNFRSEIPLRGRCEEPKISVTFNILEHARLTALYNNPASLLGVVVASEAQNVRAEAEGRRPEGLCEGATTHAECAPLSLRAPPTHPCGLRAFWVRVEGWLK